MRLPDDRTVKKIHEWKPISTRSLGRPKSRWEDDVKNDLKIMRINNWRENANARNSLRRPELLTFEVVMPGGGEGGGGEDTNVSWCRVFVKHLWRLCADKLHQQFQKINSRHCRVSESDWNY
jgi:hypothetical protein